MVQGSSPKSYSLSVIAKMTQSNLIGDPNHQITNISDLSSAKSTDASFLANRKYLPHLKECQAGVIFIAEDWPRVDGKNYLIHSDPSLAFQTVAALFRSSGCRSTGFHGIHPTAVVHPSAKIDPTATVLPHAVIDENVVIGKNSYVSSFCYVGQGAEIGDDCIIYSNVTIRERCILKNRVILQPGVVIGSCGFGYHTDNQGKHTKLEQLGNVIIEDDVEIGSNSTIDRARIDSTILRKGSKIDNLVQIAHNVEIGPDNLIVAQTGIAGSSKTGKNVIMAGQSALVGHITVPDYTVILARGALSKTVTTPGQKFAGAPGIPIKEHHRQQVYLRNIEKIVKRVEELEKEVKSLKSSSE
ncbi:MAG: UDP-3-O-(3-hydroxymyristoyl)glucosamine N-acyltransferase [Parachlamydiales bacterium]|nr:UDP-3-O-(3-hydroxymyristoyl)glucosamine N-acyltransferase [Parachlamydiales bacterium]